MKSQIVSQIPKPKFPRLMESDNVILLVVNEQRDALALTGTVVLAKKDSPYCLGDYNRGWHAPLFTDFNGTINLSNS